MDSLAESFLASEQMAHETTQFARSRFWRGCMGEKSLPRLLKPPIKQLKPTSKERVRDEMSNPQLAYWEECITCAADEGNISLTPIAITQLAEGVMGGHENYRMAFYSPTASDRTETIEREWIAKLKRLQDELDAYRENAEEAIKKALRQHSDAHVTIGKHGEVLLHGGRTDRIQ